MRIRDLNSVRAPGMAAGEHEERVLSDDTQLLFQRKLTSLSQDDHQKRIAQMIDRIHEQGERVAKRADINELQKYRSMVTELMNETVSNAYAFDKGGTLDARGRHRVFALIKKVNTRLDDMTEEVLKEQSDTIALVDAVDDIRGLLVDMFL